MAHSSHPSVLVVGGGPVGMTLAVALGQRGVPVHVIEQAPTTPTDWRASTFHPPTLELLESLGVMPDMQAMGLQVPRYQFRDRREGLVAEFDYAVLADETAFPYRLQLNQQHLVRFLVARSRDLPMVEVEHGTRLVGLTQDADGVRATVLGDHGERVIDADFVIGADGASSTVRELLGTPFEGFTYAQRFVIASTGVDMRSLLPDIADVNYVADPDEWLFLLRTPESWRVVYPVDEGLSTAEATDPERIQRHLQGVAPYPDGYPIEDFQIYSVHQRVVTDFRTGRVLLIGDAAHINSPLGGVGLNSGIHDAMDLAPRIDRILNGGALDGGDLDAELDTFASLRRQVAQEYVQADTARNTARISEKDPVARAAYHAELRATAADPDLARAWCRRSSLLESVQRFGIGAAPTSDTQTEETA